MVSHKLAQTAVWKAKTGQDAYGKATFAAEQAIPCRWDWKRRMIRSAAGQELVSEGRLFVTATVSVGDQVADPNGRNWTVIGMSPKCVMSGQELFREVMI